MLTRTFAKAAGVGVTLAAAALLAPGVATADTPQSAQPQLAAKCSGSAYAPPTGNMGKPGQANTGVAGHPGYKQGYTVTVGGDVGRAAVQVKGYEGSTAKWYGVGLIGSGDSAKASVPWGNSLAMPAIRAQVPTGSPGVYVSFNC